jgi:hypothetical protein
VTVAKRHPTLPLDHLIWAAPDLEAEVERLERLTGVRAKLGGQHPGGGSWNALLGLGADSYLEIIAPDPAQPVPARPRWFGLDTLTRPRLVTWAARATDLDRRVAEARAAGIPLGEVRSGQRELGSGELLSWRLTYPDLVVGDGVVPFLIDWGDSPHPAHSAPEGIRLLDLHAEHPKPAIIADPLERLGVGLLVLPGPRPALIATLETRRGRVVLR